MKAVILAAGKGTRLLPLTEYKPKPLLLVGGRPLLEWMLMRIKEVGVREILIVTNYLENQIIDKFGNGRAYDLNISYVRQKKMQGTADAFNKARDWIGNDEFMGLYGDHYIAEGTLKRLLKTHKKGESTVSAIEVSDVSQYGAFKLEGNLIKEIVEKPPKGTAPSNFANVGMYVFTPEIFDFIQKTTMSPRGEYEITDTLQLMIEEGRNLIKHDVSDEEWLDIGLPWMLLEANMRAMRKVMTKIDGTIEERVTLKGPLWVKEGAIIRSGSYIEGPVIVGEDSDVGPNCYLRAGTCLGKRVRIGNACEIKNSIIMDDTHAAHLSYIGDSIIGTNCNIGAGTVTANLRFDKKNIKVTVKGERLDSKRRKLGAIIGNNVETGINVSIHPGIIIGNDSWIAPGVTVQRDVPDKVIVSLRSKATSWPR